MNNNPSGALMLSRNLKHHDMVKQVLAEYSKTRSDDAELEVTVLRKFYWQLVKVSLFKNSTGEWCISKTSTMDNWRLLPCYESLRRRRQEIQHDEKERIWKLAALHLNYPVHDDAEWQATDEAQSEFRKLAKDSLYLPTERVIRKRRRNETAQKGYFSGRPTALNDWQV